MNNWGRKNCFLPFLYWADCSFCCWCCQPWVTSEFPAVSWLSGAALALFPSPLLFQSSLWQVVFWLWSATSRSFPWDLSAGRFRGFLPHGLECHEFILYLEEVLAESSFCSFTALVLLPKSHQTAMGHWQFLEDLHSVLFSSDPFFPLWASWVHLTSFEGLSVCIFSWSWSTKVGCL